MKAAKLKVVSNVDRPAPSLDYEWQQRQHISSRDWARVHVAGDRAPGLDQDVAAIKWGALSALVLVAWLLAPAIVAWVQS